MSSRHEIKAITAMERRLTLDNGMELVYFCWNPDDTDKPPALLLHGTGFVAATFDLLARQLLSRFRVYAYDRRGHGYSSKRGGAYKLADFGDDCVQICRSLDLRSAYAIGHSAGATDLLIAESRSPGLFNKIFVMEPTINDPSEKAVPPEQAWTNIQSRVQQALKRRGIFESRQQVFSSYQSKLLFQRWQTDALAAYVHYGFKDRADGSVELQCSPEIEAQILKDIFLTFANADSDDGEPFAAMGNIDCAIAITWSSESGAQYKELAERAYAHFPKAKLIEFTGLGHCVPQEDPDALAREVLAFWQD